MGQPCYSPRTPKWTGSLGLQYGIPVPNGTVTPRIDATYQSQVFFTSNNQGEQDGYALINGRLTWESQSKSWDLALWGATSRTRNTLQAS